MIELRGITKKFGLTKALSKVSLKAETGQILAIIGENGAGKSTLMNILSGTYPADSFDGEIFFNNQKVSFHSPREAQNCGVAIIHQELSTFEHLSVAENMSVGRWPLRGGIVDWLAMRVHAQAWLDVVGATFSPETLMGHLSVGAQQLVEIAKALSAHSKVLILDEPTSSLTAAEAEHLFKALRKLCADGCTILYISHKLDEVFALANRVVILRDGAVVHSAAVKEVNEKLLIEKMVGRPFETLEHIRTNPVSPEIRLSVKDLGIEFEHRKKVGPLSFQVRQGEILGLAGLLGAGRSEILRALMGGDPDQMQVSGEVEITGATVPLKNPAESLRAGLAFVGEDRKRDSLLPTRELRENVSISRLVTKNCSPFLRLAGENKLAREALDQMQTIYHSENQLITELSGGNQQKVILGRALQVRPKVLLLDEPTRGVDVGARFEIYKILAALAQSGTSLIIASSDLLELIELCDRVLVINQGQIAGELGEKEISQTAIMQLAVQGASV